MPGNITLELAVTLYVYDTIRTMQSLATAVAKGRDRTAAGFVRYDRAEALATKFEERYGSNARPSAARAQRRAGLAGSSLLMLARPEQLGFAWWLLVGPGIGPVTEQEQLQDARSREGRLWLGQFELVRLPARNGERATQWTWRMPLKDFHEFQAHAVAIATHSSAGQAQQLIAGMAAWPGWRGIAEQRREVWAAMRSARSHAGRTEALEFPAYTPWPTRLTLHGRGVSLEIAVERMRLVVQADTHP